MIGLSDDRIYPPPRRAIFMYIIVGHFFAFHLTGLAQSP